MLKKKKKLKPQRGKRNEKQDRKQLCNNNIKGKKTNEINVTFG